ncbi:MAG: ATP-binding protein, partial [Planctomycetota bacterium]
MPTEAETAPASAGNEHAFQAEISRLLELLSHSLYQNREIAIRELVSNASDALDKLRVARLSGGAPADGPELEIRLVPDDDAKTLEIRDTGVGMTREELVANLGTIAHSGSLDFLSKLSDEQKNDASIIGQFGVGFYSAFMLADRVEVVTRSASGDKTLCWASTGSGTYTIDVADEVLPRGTVIRLHLRENCGEFADETRVKYILKKYSTFVPHPIYVGDEHVNDQPPIWAEPKNSVTEEQHAKFYQYLSHHNGEDPLWTLHLAADSPIQFQTILYGPPSNAEKLGFGKAEHGLHLCAKRILVQNDCRELLP